MILCLLQLHGHQDIFEVLQNQPLLLVDLTLLTLPCTIILFDIPAVPNVNKYAKRFLILS